MALKKCSACARAIPESSAVCSYCGIAAGPAAPLTDEDPCADEGLHPLDIAFDAEVPHTSEPESDAGPAEAPPVSSAPARSRVQMLILAAAVLGSGIALLALLGVKGAAAPAASAGTSAVQPAKAPAPRQERAAAEPAALSQAPRWNVVRDGRWVGRDRRALALEVPSANKVQVWLREVRPVLVVRCIAKATEVFVFTQSAARMEPQDQDHTVSVRLDAGPARSERWPDSQEHDSLFAPDGPALAQQLMTAHTFSFGFTPHNAAPVTAHFDVTGLAELLGPAKGCGWKAAQP